MSEQIIRDVPTPTLFFLFINGFFVLLLTPLFLILPNWANPFSQQIPTEALASVALIAIFSFIAGIPGLLLKEYIIGSKCWIARLKGKKAPKAISIKVGLEKYERFQKSSFPPAIAYLSIKYQIISGIIVGAEIAFLLNVLTGIAVFFGQLKMGLFLYLISIFLCLVCGLITLVIDKYYFRNDCRKVMAAIDKKLNSVGLSATN